jgi:hypothetical protein
MIYRGLMPYTKSRVMVFEGKGLRREREEHVAVAMGVYSYI